MAVRVTQEVLEVTYQPAPNARVVQLATEVLSSPTLARARIAQTAVEALLASSAGRGRVTQLAVEVLVVR